MQSRDREVVEWDVFDRCEKPHQEIPIFIGMTRKEASGDEQSSDEEQQRSRPVSRHSDGSRNLSGPNLECWMRVIPTEVGISPDQLGMLEACHSDGSRNLSVTQLRLLEACHPTEVGISRDQTRNAGYVSFRRKSESLGTNSECWMRVIPTEVGISRSHRDGRTNIATERLSLQPFRRFDRHRTRRITEDVFHRIADRAFPHRPRVRAIHDAQFCWLAIFS